MDSTLAKRILSEKRRLIVPLAVALGLNAALYLVAVYPLTVKVANAERNAARAADNVRRAEGNYTQARGMVLGKERADEELRRFYREVLPTDLAGARRITYLRLAQLAERSNLRYERRTVSADQDPESALSKLRMTMVLAGEYEDIRRFIHQLETAPEFVVVEDVALAQSEEGRAPLVLTLQVSTYFRGGGDGT